MNELEELARKYGTDKRTNNPGERHMHGYTIPYYELFKDKKYEYTNVLEIGLFEGASHRMWRDFFPNAMIYCINHEEDKSYSKLTEEELGESGRIRILWADQADEKEISRFFKDIVFDLIIDDGGHMNFSQQKSFKILFPKLKTGGYYIIEDLGVHYNRDFRDRDDINSTTMSWLNFLKGGIPFSYYIEEEEMKKFMEEIESIEILEGELGIIKKG